MTIYRGPGGTGTATSDSDTTEFQEFVFDAQAARDAALAAQTAAELAETNAETAETNAETAETNAETAATNAASSASSAASSASSASSSASSASTSASNASSSASSASTSASAASSSASAASTSASNAATSATNAASSATAAASSASSAASSASTATTQATNAAASASAASTSASSASAAQTAAEAARDAALSAYDNFDDRYLGPKSSDPTLDNDGNALLTGALYFNTACNVMKVYTGSSWVAAYVSAAGVLLTANNLSDVASTATSRTNLNVPTRTGGDASGTWGINITGNAATATTATSATSATSATTATNVSGGTASVTSITDSGNLTFTGTGNRITGDFSNATHANRVAFQSSTTNGATTPFIIPNGTGTTASIVVANASDPTNSSFGQLAVSGTTDVRVLSGQLGTGSYLPLTFYTGGSERMRVDTSGNLGIGTSSPNGRLQVTGGTANASNLATAYSAAAFTLVPKSTSGFSLAFGSGPSDFPYIQMSAAGSVASDMTLQPYGGNVGIGTASPGGKLEVNQGKLVVKTTDQSLSRVQIANTGTGGRTWELVGGLPGVNNSNFSIYDVTGSTTPLTIDSNGNLLVGTTATTSNARLAVKTSSTSNLDYGVYVANSGGGFLLGIDNNGGFATGSAAGSPYNATTASAANVFVASSGLLQRSTSSLKYKKDVQDAAHGLAEVMTLRPVTYKGKTDGETIFGGLIAEEVHEAGLTEFVQYAEDGSPDALAYGQMVSLAFKAIQEQQAIIAALTARVEALESN